MYVQRMVHDKYYIKRNIRPVDVKKETEIPKRKRYFVLYDVLHEKSQDICIW
jgi:hypothetical protein